MNIYRLIFSFFLFYSSLLGYEDSDIDGVDDAIDLCPDSSFDKLVDEDGCAEDEHYWGSVTLQLGNDIALDEDNNKINNYSFLGSYSYKKWYLSLSNTQQTTYDKSNNRSTSGGDIYFNSGYQLNHNNLQTDIGFGVKLATANKTIGTGENDYFGSIGFNYFMNEKLMLFTQIGYTFTGDNNETSYQNSLAYSLGAGYMFNPQWYSSISYDDSDSIYQNTERYKSFSWLNSYSFLDDYFISFNYTYGLDDLSYPHIFSLKLGTTFE